MNLNYNDGQAGIGQTERQALDVLSRLGKPTIRAHDLETTLGYSREISNLMLSRLCKKGWVQRLKSGIYRIVPLGSESANPVPEDAWAIAMELFAPCYISGWTAAEHWELTEQIFNSTMVFTSQKQRKNEVVIAGLKYRTKLSMPEHIFGIKKIWSSNTQIHIADIHRTIIDILDDPEIGGGGRQTIDMLKAYFQHKDADAEILYQYAEKLQHNAVFKRLGFILSKIKPQEVQSITYCLEHLSRGNSQLDPTSKGKRLIKKWRLWIPEGLEGGFS